MIVVAVVVKSAATHPWLLVLIAVVVFVVAAAAAAVVVLIEKEYGEVQSKQAELRAKMELLKNHFRLKRSGLDSLFDEIDNMITHRAMTYVVFGVMTFLV